MSQAAGLTAASSLLGLAFSGDDAACVSDIKEEYSDPLWPSGKALGWSVSRRASASARFRFGSPFSSKRLWFVDFVLHM